jgi:hypothetical protein
MKCVSVKWCKLILCCVKQCKCKNNIYMVLHGSIKQWKCKNIYVYMILHGYVKQCKYITM